MSNNKLERLEEALVKLSHEIARQGLLLDEHQRRSLALEEEVNQLWASHGPVEKHIAMWSGALKALGVIGTLSGIAAAIVKVLSGK